MNENTTELVVTAPLDREESENYRLLLVCTVRTETVITKVETSLDVFVDDEDDNAPYLNGTDTADVVISFNRSMVRRFPRRRVLDGLAPVSLTSPTSSFALQGGSFGGLSVFDRDLTPIIGRSHNKYVGTLLNVDPWVKETFDIRGTFSERKAAQGGIRETVHVYREQPGEAESSWSLSW